MTCLLTCCLLLLLLQSVQLWPATQVRSTRGSKINVAGNAADVDAFVLTPGDYGSRHLEFNLLRDFRTSVIVQVRAQEE